MKTISDMFEFKQNPISVEDHISYMRDYILRNSFKYTLEEKEIPEDFEGLQKLEKILTAEKSLNRNYQYRKLLLANKEKMLEEYGIEIMRIKKKTHYVKRLNWMPDDPEKKELLENLRDRINEILEENEGKQVEFKSLMQVIMLDISEINEKQISYYIKVLIDLEEIDGNKILNFIY